MGKSEARRQKQLAKKKAKRQEKRTLLTRETSKDPTVRFVGIADWPVHEARMSGNLWASGVGYIIVARNMPSGEIAMGVYLVDVFCLGVKKTFYQIMSRRVYVDYIKNMSRDLGTEVISPEYAAKVVTRAVAYAESLGFVPDAEYRRSKLVLGGIDPAACPDEMTFGKDGKPLYIRGPNESMGRAERIAQKVQQAGGDFVLLENGPDAGDDYIGTGARGRRGGYSALDIVRIAEEAGLLDDDIDESGDDDMDEAAENPVDAITHREPS